MKIRASDPFQAIADPSRRRILSLLSRNRLTINAVSEHFDMSRPAVSKHIKILHSAGFISIDEIGRERYCTLDTAGFLALQEWMRYFDGFWRGKLGALDKFLSSSSSEASTTLPEKFKPRREQPKTLSQKSKAVTGKPRTVPGKPKALGAKPKTLSRKSKAVAGKPKTVPEKPKALAAKPETVRGKPKALRPEKRKTIPSAPQKRPSHSPPHKK